MRVLVIEDSERLRRSLSTGLRRNGFTVEVAADGLTGLRHALAAEFDAIVLDLRLPEIDGLEVLRQLRASGNQVHVLILSARDRVADRIQGLDVGADDYLVKPFSFDELAARLRSLGRRRFDQKDPLLSAGLLRLNTAARRAWFDEQPLDLSALELRLLELLLLERGRPVSRSRILDRLYDSSAEPNSNVVEVLVYSLRRKLRLAGVPDLVRTRRGEGYVVEADS